MNKKGFTLIELLAVIVILAIIALIATPIVLNIINDSKESAQLRSAEMYLKGVETSIATATINNKKVADGTYPITKDGDICLVELIDNKCDKDNTLKVEMNGEKPESGSITIASGKVADIELTYSNKKTLVKNTDGKLVYDDEKSTNQQLEQKVTITPKKENYAIGDGVTLGEESFYVIADDNEKVTLLTKDCINTLTLLQEAMPENLIDEDFSETSYWSNIEGITYPYDLIEIGEPDASHKAAKAAYNYGTKVGGTGRLMLYSEAISLATTNSDILYGTNGKSSNMYLWYWLGTASNEDDVWCVSGGVENLVEIPIDGPVFSVRPVVEISKSKIN